MKKAILLALLLSGCSEYYEQRNQAIQDDHQNRCASYGLKFGTSPFAQCMVDLDEQDMANRRALVGAYIANQPQQRPYVLPMPAPPAQTAPRSCISQVAGQTIYTNCY